MRLRIAEKDDYLPMLGLSSCERWALNERDIQLIFDAGGGFVVADDDTGILGMGSYLPYKKYGWIGNIVVRKDVRRHGIGRLITQQCVQHLIDQNVVPALFSVKDAEHLYQACGFIPCGEYVNFGGWITRKMVPPYRISHVSKGNPDEILGFDFRHWGDNRGLLLRKMGKSGELLIAKEEKIRGYILGIREDSVLYIGPWVADSIKDAHALFNELLRRELHEHSPIYVDISVPATNISALRIVRPLLTRIDSVSEMHLNGSSLLRQNGVYSCASIDKG